FHLKPEKENGGRHCALSIHRMKRCFLPQWRKYSQYAFTF
ncbi:hypothetical protein HMPREF9544_03289, partial [Escherichia coli MS 153-1]